MREMPVEFDGRRVGTLTVHEEGLYLAVRAACSLPGGALYRLALCGAQGSLSLGVLEPQQGKHALRCRLPRARLDALGALTHGQAVRSFYLDAAARWERVTQPFFTDAQLQAALNACPGARCRGADTRELALPYAAQRPFPLVQCFCFARVGELDGAPCVFYRFVGDRPIF